MANKVIYNLTMSNVALDGGKIRLGPRGAPGDRCNITDAQAALSDVVSFSVQNKVRVLSVDQASQFEVSTKVAVAAKAAEAPKPAPKSAPAPTPAPAPAPAPAPVVAPEDEKVATLEDSDADAGSDNSDNESTGSEQRGKKSRKHKK